MRSLGDWSSILRCEDCIVWACVCGRVCLFGCLFRCAGVRAASWDGMRAGFVELKLSASWSDSRDLYWTSSRGV